jgi:hypothetical protein
MSIFPAAPFKSAPSFAALVASSWKSMARVNAAFRAQVLPKAFDFGFGGPLFL